MRFVLISALVCLSLSGWNAFGADLTLRDGSRLRGYKISTVEVNGLKVIHADGIVQVDFDDLPAQMQKAYGWTEEKAKARHAMRLAKAEATLVGQQSAETPHQ